MKAFLGASVLLELMLLAVPALAQTHPLRGPESSAGAIEPDQPVRPQLPVLVQRAPQQPAAQAAESPQPPFSLTAQEQTEVDSVLKQWEERNHKVKTFDSKFRRWSYDLVFNPPKPGQTIQPAFVETGTIKYAAPDRGLFRVETTEKDGKDGPVEDGRAEHWISDGKSIFIFQPGKKQLIEQRLPPELQGKSIADGPLPFVFGAEAKKLQSRYWIRLVTPPNVKGQIWLEAFPRFQEDAANFHHAQFIVTADGMSPYALKLVQQNQKDYVVYQFFDIVVNDPWRMFQGNPFRAYTPLGWTKIVKQPQPEGQAQPPGQRRGVERLAAKPRAAAASPGSQCSNLTAIGTATGS